MANTGRSDDVVKMLQEMETDLKAELARVQRMLNAANGIETRTNTTEVLLEIFQDNPWTEFTASDAEAEIRARGWVTESSDPVNAVRAALARLKNNGEIESVGRGRFQLTPDEEPKKVVPANGGYDDPWGDPPAPGSGAASDDEPPF